MREWSLLAFALQLRSCMIDELSYGYMQGRQDLKTLFHTILYHWRLNNNNATLEMLLDIFEYECGWKDLSGMSITPFQFVKSLFLAANLIKELFAPRKITQILSKAFYWKVSILRKRFSLPWKQAQDFSIKYKLR